MDENYRLITDRYTFMQVCESNWCSGICYAPIQFPELAVNLSGYHQRAGINTVISTF